MVGFGEDEQTLLWEMFEAEVPNKGGHGLSWGRMHTQGRERISSSFPS